MQGWEAAALVEEADRGLLQAVVVKEERGGGQGSAGDGCKESLARGREEGPREQEVLAGVRLAALVQAIFSAVIAPDEP